MYPSSILKARVVTGNALYFGATLHPYLQVLIGMNEIKIVI